jgi:uncharacterized membrane protein
MESETHRGWRGWWRRLVEGAADAGADAAEHDQRLEAIAAIATALARARDLETAARPLVEQVRRCSASTSPP